MLERIKLVKGSVDSSESGQRGDTVGHVGTSQLQDLAFNRELSLLSLCSILHVFPNSQAITPIL